MTHSSYGHTLMMSSKTSTPTSTPSTPPYSSHMKRRKRANSPSSTFVYRGRETPSPPASTEKPPTLTGTSTSHPTTIPGLRQESSTASNRGLTKSAIKSTINQERNHLQDTFEANGYPRRVVQQALRKQWRAETEETEETRSEGDQGETKLLILPYLKNTSEQIERTCRAIRVKAVFKSQCTLRRSLTRVKSTRPDLKKKEVVYEVPCMDCDSKYIGETGRNLQKRLTEHKAAVRKGDRKNGIAVHLQDHDHRVDWEAARVIGQEPYYWKRRVLEALHISRSDKTSNLDCGLALDPIWAPFVSC